jgi:hypothetical protein
VTAVLQELARIRGSEVAAREQALAAEVFSALAYVAPAADTTAPDRARAFVAFCADRGVNHLPASCVTVAAFLLAHAEMPPTIDCVLDVLDAIEGMHDAAGLPSPVRSSIVGAALGRWPAPGAPRSWPKADNFHFHRLPLLTRHIIVRREGERDREMRRVHSELAAMKDARNEWQPDSRTA